MVEIKLGANRAIGSWKQGAKKRGRKEGRSERERRKEGKKGERKEGKLKKILFINRWREDTD